MHTVYVLQLVCDAVQTIDERVELETGMTEGGWFKKAWVGGVMLSCLN